MATRIYITRPPQNPILAFLYLVAAGALIITALVMGAVILAVVFGLGLIVALVIWVRIWWLRRKMGKSTADASAPVRVRIHARARAGARRADGRRGVEIKSVDYEVIDERDDDER